MSVLVQVSMKLSRNKRLECESKVSLKCLSVFSLDVVMLALKIKPYTVTNRLVLSFCFSFLLCALLLYVYGVLMPYK